MPPTTRPGSGPDAKPRIILIGPPDTACAAARILLPAAASGRAHIMGVVTLSPLEAETVRDFEDPAAPSISNLGPAERLEEIQRRVDADLAVVCIPAAFGRATARIKASLKALGLPASFVPTPEDILDAKCGAQVILEALPGVAPPAVSLREPGVRAETGVPRAEREIDPALLIGRPPREQNAAEVARARRLLRGKRVLITGAGGSIGSELSFAVAALEPDCLMLMERAENALFEIDRRLGERFPGVARRAMLHDVVEAPSTRDWLLRLKPDVVFHAAAHKHVTVMEDHPAHAVNNNVFGAKSIADASREAGVSRFVMISTDKAVNPRNVMGATKRFAELYVRACNDPSAKRGAATRFSMVRFGNVLGSACSVLPIWTKQLVDGAPLTVTHPEMTRYFMTIPEAARLVIQAGALDPEEASGADIFVLDMGEPVRIVELAERFARAHGLTPRVRNRADQPGGPTARGGVDIVFTGPRPGEKLHEELAHASEELRPTPATGVLAWAGAPTSVREVEDLIGALSKVRYSADRDEVVRAIARFAPGVPEPQHASEAGGLAGSLAAQKPLVGNDLRTSAPVPASMDLSAA